MGVVQSIRGKGSPFALIPLFFMGKGLASQKFLRLAIERVYKNLATSGCDTFDHFHSSILSIFKIANSVLPGKRFEAPSRGELEAAFEEWKSSSNDEEKKKIFKDLLGRTKLGKIDKLTLMVGLATPPFSMVAKRAGEKGPPPFKMIKNVPDFLYVPSVTVLTLFSVKLIRKAVEKHGEETQDKETNASL